MEKYSLWVSCWCTPLSHNAMNRKNKKIKTLLIEKSTFKKTFHYIFVKLVCLSILKLKFASCMMVEKCYHFFMLYVLFFYKTIYYKGMNAVVHCAWWNMAADFLPIIVVSTTAEKTRTLIQQDFYLSLCVEIMVRSMFTYLHTRTLEYWHDHTGRDT